jgi:hypothetical protein
MCRSNNKPKDKAMSTQNKERAPKYPSDGRDRIMALRLTESEFLLLKKLADQNYIPISSWVRQTLLRIANKQQD